MRMTAVEGRCVALEGEVGSDVCCTLYRYRPHVCRRLQAGDEACVAARVAKGLPPGPGA
jgi:Fe-S-cluster containining protein